MPVQLQRFNIVPEQACFTPCGVVEVVERRGGYKGYGAPNAPFRIAAQKRHLRPKGMPRELRR